MKRYPITLKLFTDEYYQALGHFISDFSEIEQALQLTLWRLTGVDTPMAKAVFSGVRSEEATNKITRIKDAQKWPKKRCDEWEEISSRVGVLRKLRNDILHYGANWVAPGTWISSNADFVHLPDRTRSRQVTITDLRNAAHDTKKLSMHLFVFLFADEMTIPSLQKHDPVLKSAWRYKPRPPKRQR
jgi:hypothetical protein